MEPDSQWTVRSALADVLGTLPPNVALERTRSMLRDEDRRVVPSVLNALARLKAPDMANVALSQLKEPDFVVRATAARIVGELKPQGGVEALHEALKLAGADAAIDARAAILSALAEYGAAAATADVKNALSDKDWAVRVHAATLLRKLEPGFEQIYSMPSDLSTSTMKSDPGRSLVRTSTLAGVPVSASRTAALGAATRGAGAVGC